MTTQGARSSILRPIPFHYCAGCSHSVLHRLLAEVIEELDLHRRAVGVCGVGCSFLMYDFLDLDFVSSSPGRAPSVAAGLKRAVPDAAVFTYQGETDALSAGLTDLVHAVSRNEKITMLVVNNCATGLSGGQLSPTVLAGQKTRTTPAGRDPQQHGHPIRLSEMLAGMDLPARIERVALNSPENVERARLALRAAFRFPLEGRGTALVEVLGSCTTYWGLSPTDAETHVAQTMVPAFPLGRFGRNEEG
ncbi:MAG: 2-oxoglutarate oxidoreductase [Candidatus Riflebacteria bacterium]|nr:2-oxoglutarate oxidoreductase [Candidatus Riflebacteria bacterium]